MNDVPNGTGANARITLRVDYKRMNTFFADYAKNISKGGSFIRTDKPLPVGTAFLFVLALPDGAPIELEGVVESVVGPTENAAAPPAGMKLRFVFDDEQKRKALETDIRTRMNAALGAFVTHRLLD
jgi:type IV pilus assembly protein PilZ